MVGFSKTLLRREAIGLIAGALAAPFAARAQQPVDRPRRLGVLSVTASDDPIAQVRTAVLKEGLAALGWKEGENFRFEWRDGNGERARIARFAGELVALEPDVILAVGTPCVDELRRRTSTIPIVFAVVTDPVGRELWQASRSPAATSPVSPITTGRWPANGLTC